MALIVSGGGASLLAQTPPNALPAPVDFVGDAISDSEVRLSWRDVASDETEYRVERSPFDFIQWQEVASLDADTTSYVDTNLTCEMSFFYRVRAYRASDDTFSSYSPLVTATTRTCLPPAPPDGLTYEAAEGEIVLNWAALDLSRGQVLIERTTNSAIGWNDSGQVEVDQTSYTDTAIICGLSYEYRLRALRASDDMLSDYSATLTAQAAPCADDPGAPTIDVFYTDENDTLHFGQVGNAAQWLNILGNITDPDGVEAVTYSLYGGPQEALPLGPNDTRLVYSGDFNIEIDRTDLPAGQFVVRIEAVDTTGARAYRTVTVDYTDANRWPIPYSIDWSEVTDITAVAQVVDGQWEITSEGLHPVKPGYDRLIAIGEDDWTGNMEVVTTFTLHSRPSPSAIGLVLGWQGHQGFDRPRVDWPLEALTWMEAYGSGFMQRITTYPGTVWMEVLRSDIELDTSYTLHARTERLANGMSRISQRMWRTGEPEPDTWDASADVPEFNGSVMLVAHWLDTTFHTIEITRLETERPPTPPTPLPTVTPRSPS